MSPGIRSGVNCTRLVSTASAAASERTSSVLATPGTPSISTCPPDEQRDEQPGDGGVLADHGLGDLGADPVQRLAGGLGCHAQLGHGWCTSLSSAARSLGQSGQGGVVRHRPGRQQVVHVRGVAAGRAGRPRRPARGTGRDAEPEPGREPSPGGRAQDARRVRAVAHPCVEPAAALGGLDGLHHHGEGLDARAARAGDRATASWPGPQRPAATGPARARGAGRPGAEPASPAATSRRSGTYHTSRSRWPSSRSATAALSASSTRSLVSTSTPPRAYVGTRPVDPRDEGRPGGPRRRGSSPSPGCRACRGSPADGPTATSRPSSNGSRQAAAVRSVVAASDSDQGQAQGAEHARTGAARTSAAAGSAVRAERPRGGSAELLGRGDQHRGAGADRRARQLRGPPYDGHLDAVVREHPRDGLRAATLRGSPGRGRRRGVRSGRSAR